ncbi:hypothetical protein JEZ13_06905 [bacterium]|nr:hypothetical protein [bacterium]
MNHFDVIILLGRPASGKSEIIDFIKRRKIVDRLENYHIANIAELDDFPMLWTWFEEDHIRENVLKVDRIHSTSDGYFLHNYQWNLLIERFNLEYEKLMTEEANFFQDHTLLIEFSRGSEHGGYKSAFKHLSSNILKKAVIFYVDVPWEESLRKNRRRFNPDKPHSILEHGLPDDKLARLYKEVDWEDFIGTSKDYLTINNVKVPYISLHNIPEITNSDEKMELALKAYFSNLWRLYQAK